MNNNVKQKTTAGDSQKTIFFTVFDYFLFPVLLFSVHASVSMGFWMAV